MQNSELAEVRSVSGPFSRKIFWAQSRALTEANLKSRYRNTVAGFLWVVMNPLITFGAQSYVFHTILKLQVSHYNLFLLSGLLPWIFFQQSVEMCTSLFISAARLLKSLPVHPLVYLVSQLLDNLVNLLAAFLLILLPTLLFQPFHPLVLLLIPIPLLILLLGVFGICWIMAVLQVFLRDTRFIATFGLNILFFLTPIIYPAELVPAQYRWVLLVNPLNYLIQPFRILLLDFDFARFMLASLKAAIVSSVFLCGAFLLWGKKKNEVYHAI
jgi:lipopolysaccharide transport system permease protein